MIAITSDKLRSYFVVEKVHSTPFIMLDAFLILESFYTEISRSLAFHVRRR